MLSITPFLWFDTDLAEPIKFYMSVFPNAVTNADPLDKGPIYSADIKLCGQQLTLFHAGLPPASFNESVSLFVSVDTQDEIDDLWEKLTANGGEPGNCGWLKDRFGLSWQVVPTSLGSLLGASDRTRAQQATDAMMQMSKLDIAELQAAYDR